MVYMTVAIAYALAILTILFAEWFQRQPQPDRGDESREETREAAKRCADYTKRWCESGACHLGRFACCDKVYCDGVDRALLDRGIRIEQPWLHGLPFMGEGGCVVPPHLRPVCALYGCASVSVEPHRLKTFRLPTAGETDGFLEDWETVRRDDEATRELYDACVGITMQVKVIPGEYTDGVRRFRYK